MGFVPASAHALVLITREEAAAPDADATRGISLGPKVEMISPPPNGGAVTSPFDLQIRFTSHGGAAIVTDSLVVTYQKRPLIDLSHRVRTLATPEGLRIREAEAPPGTHRVMVEIRDTRGRRGWGSFLLRVLPPSR